MYEKRLLNLRRLLLREHSVAAFARRIGTAPPYIFQLMKGRNNVGDELARKIEAAYGYEHGWLDELEEDRRRAAIPPETIDLAEEFTQLPPDVQAHFRQLIKGWL